MFTDPITITVNGVSKTLNRIDLGDLSSGYASTDGVWKINISHVVTTKGRVRSTVEFYETKIVDVATGREDSLLIRLLFDRPKSSWSSTEVEYDRAALFAFVSTANMLKLFGLES